VVAWLPVGEEGEQVHVECMQPAIQQIQPRQADAAFNVADVGEIYAELLRERLRREAAPSSLPPQPRAELPALFRGHQTVPRGFSNESLRLLRRILQPFPA